MKLLKTLNAVGLFFLFAIIFSPFIGFEFFRETTVLIFFYFYLLIIIAGILFVATIVIWLLKNRAALIVLTSLIYALIVFLFFIQISIENSSEAFSEKNGVPVNEIPDFDFTSHEIDLDTLLVSDLVKLLKIKRGENYFHLFAKNKMKPERITKEDIVLLIRLIDSKDTARCIIMDGVDENLANTASYDYSTIGGHAMDLIDCYRYKYYYPSWDINCTKEDSLRALEIKKWFASVKS